MMKYNQKRLSNNNEVVKSHKHYLLYAFLFVIISTQISSFIIMYQQFSLLRAHDSSLEKQVFDSNQELKMLIEESDQRSLSLISGVSNSIMQTESSLKSEISSIKAKTSSDFSGVIEQAVRGVVSIHTDVAQGSGFFVSSDGYLVTNAHVLSKAHYAEVIDYDKKSKYAKLVGYDSDLDLALLKVDGTHEYLKFSDDLSLGEKVIAIGNPLGLSFSVTEGIVSSKDRKASDSNSASYIQTDVALNPGNSGGPLIDTEGLVVGINNFKIGGAENIGFSLQSEHIVSFINEVMNETLVSL